MSLRKAIRNMDRMANEFLDGLWRQPTQECHHAIGFCANCGGPWHDLPFNYLRSDWWMSGNPEFQRVISEYVAAEFAEVGWDHNWWRAHLLEQEGIPGGATPLGESVVQVGSTPGCNPGDRGSWPL